MDFTAHELEGHSSDKQFVEHYFNLGTFRGEGNTTIKKIWALNCPILSTDFEKVSSRMHRINCWKVLGEGKPLKNTSSWKELVNHHSDWRKFHFGDIPIPKSNSGEIFAVAMVSVAVGNSLLLHDFLADESIEDNVLVPSDYDSVHFHQSCKKDSSRTFCIGGPSQALPLFVVFFEFDSASNFSQKQEMCSFCNTKKADVYCLSDQASLCHKCDKKVHEANILVQKHERIPISEKGISNVRGYGQCTEHANVELQFYCESCKIPVCVNCKMVGNHSSGQASLHKLVPIRDAYESAIERSNKPDARMNGRKSDIESNIEDLNKKMISIKDNAKEAKQKVMDMMNSLLEEIDEMEKQKIDVIISEKSELERQYEEINWIDSYLIHQQQHSSPVQFLHEWKRHDYFRNLVNTSYSEKTRSKNKSMSVQGDIDISGEIRLVSSGKLVKQIAKEPVIEDLDIMETMSLSSKYSMATTFKESILNDLNNPRHPMDANESARSPTRFSKTLSMKPEDMVYSSIKSAGYRHNNRSSLGKRGASVTKPANNAKSAPNEDMWKNAWLSRNNALI